MSTATLDPITLEIVWNGLLSVTDECFISLMRAAYSTNIKERHDHSIAIADAGGRLIAQSQRSLPVHISSMKGLIDKLLEKYSDIEEGDLFLANDPHVAGGTHLPDLNFAMPVFIDGRLTALVCNIAHHADVGGAAAGSMSGGLNEIWKEGLRIPVVRLMRKGQLNQEMMDIILLNMRLPHERKGDINAQIAACRLGVDRVKDLARRYGTEVVTGAFEEIVARTKARMKAGIRSIPDGRYTFEDVLDDDGLAARDVRFKLTVDKLGEDMRFDWTGSDPQVPGNVNLTYNAVQACVFFGLKAVLDPELPNNQGVIDAVEIIAPAGTVANCVSPGAVALRANTCQRGIDVVLGALAQALPEKVVAAGNGANVSAVFAGNDPASGRPYVYLETLAGGMGGRFAKDGKDGVQVGITNTSNLPVEAIEMEYPLRVHAYGFIEDSGGAGRHRGGLGLRRVVSPVGHTCEFSGVGERFVHQPWGIFCGGPGATGRFLLDEGKVERRQLANKVRMALAPDQTVIIETPGAGGYGPPEERTREAVEGDQRSGKFTSGYIERHYGKRQA
ncbi:MAG TPA: hydantoinase B/oxoprolinase family protein [Hyphomicrobiaceae bacterium]|nr:hydantoinase B/oxoprolinase family protein [Hyphomicrobiaceae bacterium]